MAREMRLAVLAAKDLVRVEVGVVNETHAGGLWPGQIRILLDWAGVDR